MPRRSTSVLDFLEGQGIRLGLEEPKRLCGILGSPQLTFPAVLVAGTNGKGSTASLLASMSIAAGYRTGLYTSPHLESVTERISVDRQPISDRELDEILQHIVDTARSCQLEPPTLFEALTLAAFEYFAARSLDLAVFEVGLGGRLDATNITDPIVSVMTSIGLDHQSFLGYSRAEIVGEKCGVLRAGRPVIAWGGDPEIDLVLQQEADRRQAPLSFASECLSLEPLEAPHVYPQRILWKSREIDERREIELALTGYHQLENLGLAIATAETLRNLGWSRLGPDAIAEGSRSCRWPGRAEWVLLPDGRRILLDGAHNPAGAGALASILESLERPPDLLFGVLAEKDAESMLSHLVPHCRNLTLTRPTGARGLDPSPLAHLVGQGSIFVDLIPQDALRQSLGRMAETLVICGSLVLVGEMRRELRTLFGAPPPTTER